MKLHTYPYDIAFDPPMPVVEVQIHAPGHEPLPRTFSALVDSGADGTLIPVNLLEAAGARYVGEARLRGITGTSLRVDIYLLNLRVGSQWVRGVRVAAVTEPAEIVLGRNVLNHLVITLNGLAGVTEIAAEVV